MTSTLMNSLFQGTKIFDILVRDGDTGKPRKIDVGLVGDVQNFFDVDVKGHDENGVLSAAIVKSEQTTLDREIEVSKSTTDLTSGHWLTSEFIKQHILP